jgi:alkanesulfonate monooxygenase SsuD/methylene tetrahydromethanopterin reductase-like flavin-dependent oxidoreductase (luciferase family)
MVPIARPTCYSLVRHLWLEPIERAEYIRAIGERQHAPDLRVPIRALHGMERLIMRFGTFVFSISHDPSEDHLVIENTLREVELAEAIGLDAVWLTEHHFDGAVAYADPLVFGAAVAMRTRRVRIGFAVVEMALHHPIRLAVQTSLLDNLSRGRLIVGTGRGSAYNEFEYIGFGTTMDEGRHMMAEAEDLLVKAWTGEDVQHKGRYWNLAFPRLRPPPYQKPHPPLVRACIGEASMLDMAKIGRPVLIGVQTLDTLRQRLRRYKETLLTAGFDEGAVEKALDETWAQRALYVAESNDEALEVAAIALKRYRHHLDESRRRYNPGGLPPRSPDAPPSPNEMVEHAFLAGTPKRVAEQIAALRDAGVRNLLLNVNVGQMLPEQVERSMKLFGEKVLPVYRA